MEFVACKNPLYLGDDNGDGDCTFRCDLSRGHEGLCRETGQTSAPFTITWQFDPNHPEVRTNAKCQCGNERYWHRIDRDTDETFECEKVGCECKQFTEASI